MKISEIVKREENNKDIILHKEGMFWRAYEYSAYTFVKNIKQYNAKKKFIKKVNSDIVFINRRKSSGNSAQSRNIPIAIGRQ